MDRATLADDQLPLSFQQEQMLLLTQVIPIMLVDVHLLLVCGVCAYN